MKTDVWNTLQCFTFSSHSSFDEEHHQRVLKIRQPFTKRIITGHTNNMLLLNVYQHRDKIVINRIYEDEEEDDDNDDDDLCRRCGC